MLPQTGTTVGATTNRILRSNSLTLEVEYLRLFHDMSMKNPDSKDGKMNKCKPSKKGNGKGIDRGRSKGKGKGKGKGLVEEDCPEEAPSQAPAPVVAPTPGKWSLFWFGEIKSILSPYNR